MRKLVMIVLIGVFAVGVYGAKIHKATEVAPSAVNKSYEPRGVEILPLSGRGSNKTALLENNSVLVDSSQNGFGLVVSETNPISVNPNNTDQVIMAYRQYTDGSNAGSIGAAYSEDGGATWRTYSNINYDLNDQGRYPSALAGESYPIVLWNEYSGGGGDYEGRAYYSFDEFQYGGGFFYPPIDIHNSPLENDSWVVVPTQNVDADGNFIMNVVVSDWSNDRDRIHFRAQTNDAWDGTELDMSDASNLVSNAQDFRFEFDDAGDVVNYTSNGKLDINSEGTGYFVLSSYWTDSLLIANHTLFAKKTIDYGASWSDWYHIPDETMNNYFWDVFPDSIPDTDTTWSHLPEGWTPFIAYDMDILADESGGLHVLAPILPGGDAGVYPYWSPNNGIYHLGFSSDAFAAGSGPINPEISFIASMPLGWQILDTDGTAGYQQNGVGLSYDTVDPDKLYMVYYTASDTITIGEDFFSYLNIMGSYSIDNGANWSEPHNISQTDNPDIDEIYPHVNRFAVDGEVFIMYQIPDYDQPTVDGPEVGADYLNRVYFMRYDFDEAVSVNDDYPQLTSFVLNDNYPNPFNPTSLISFFLPSSGMTELSIFDITGREVQTLHRGVLNAGEHQFTFRASGLSSGAYFYRLDSQGFTDVKKMLLIK